MDSLSSSFLRECTSITSLSPASTPSALVRFKISSVLTNEEIYGSPVRKTSLNPKKPAIHNLKVIKPSSVVPHDVAEQDADRVANGRKKQSLISTIFRSLDHFICDFIDPPLRATINPKLVLSGNFAPVDDELPPTACEVEEGSLPPSLDGAFIRNGPNPQFFPIGPYHLFDGDAMLHSVKICDGKATLCSRYVKTYKYIVEGEMGSPVFINVFSAFNGMAASLARVAVTFGRVLTGQYDLRRGFGNANTSLALLNGNLFALGESDLPYRIKITPDGDIINLGRYESFGKESTTMTAHPKIDPETQEAFAYRQSITFTSPFLIYFKINVDGEKQQDVPVWSLKEASLIHDFFISKTYAIFPDSQIVLRPVNILKGIPAVSADPKKVPRLGIIPRNTEDGDEMRWIDTPGFNMIHAANAWDEDGGERVVIVAANIIGVENFLDQVDLVRFSMERVEINVKEKSVKRVPLSKHDLEFGVINPAFLGRKNRYVYAAIGAPMPKISGVAKIDLSLSTVNYGECTVASRLYGPSFYGGETIFVAREPGNPAADEDDGYLITYIHNEISEESKLIVMDAKSPDLEIVALVKLPARVPYGFHGIFVHGSDLNACYMKP